MTVLERGIKMIKDKLEEQIINAGIHVSALTQTILDKTDMSMEQVFESIRETLEIMDDDEDLTRDDLRELWIKD